MNEPKPQTLDGPAICAPRRAALEKLLAQQAIIEAIVSRLPASVAGCVSARDADAVLQLSDLNRQQVRKVMEALAAGKWKRRPCHADGALLDYETEIDGIKVLLFASRPPESCRIVTEEITVQAHTETRRTLVCK